MVPLVSLLHPSNCLFITMPKDWRHFPILRYISFVGGTPQTLDRQHRSSGFRRLSNSPRFSILGKFTRRPRVRQSSRRRIVTVTEQLLPLSRSSIVDSDQHVVEKETCIEDIDARVILLSPFPDDCPPFAKSTMSLSSDFGSIRAEVHRLPGAENHIFRLFLHSFQSTVTVTLPPSFHGVIHVDDYWHPTDACSSRVNVRCNKPVYDRIEGGFIRFSQLSKANADEDELYIQAFGRVDLRIRDWENKRPVWRPWKRRNPIRKVLRMS